MNKYTLLVVALFGLILHSFPSLADINSPSREIALPDTNLAAISSSLRSLNGKPFNVILTPQIRDSANELARGVHTIHFKLAPESLGAFVINGIEVSPGETISFDQNLSLNNHRLRIEAYPSQTGVEMSSDFTLHIPKINFSVCPQGFSASGERCIYLDIKPAEYACQTPFTLTGANQCERIFSYPMDSVCADGYSLTDLTCSRDLTLPMVATCPPNFGLAPDGVTCNQHHAVDAEVCPFGSTLESGMCSDGENFTPTALYCDGYDVSSGELCADGKCYTYQSSWNACDVTSTVPAVNICSDGFEIGGSCILAHSYTLDAECEFGYIRDGINCSRLLTEPAEKQCADPYTLSTDQSYCSHFVYEPFTSCPSTHQLVDGRCHLLAEITINCPNTHEWNGTTCEKLVNYPANPICPTEAGWTDNNTGCDYFDSLEAQSCQSGYLFSDGDCYSVVSSTQVCPLNYVNNGSGLCEYNNTLPVLSCPANYNIVDGLCYEVVEANESCLTPGFGIVGGICQRIDVTEVDSCPSGSVLIAGNCHDLQIATEQCPAGSINNGNTCVSTAIEPIANCPSGYLLSAGKCYQIVNAAQLCSPGFSNNGSGQCVRTLSIDVSSCRSNHVLFNGDCYAVEKPIQFCPPGYVSDGDGTCSSFQSTGVIACPSGYVNQSGECRRVVNASQSCPSGYVNDGDGTCSDFDSTNISSCPSGSVLFGGSCYPRQPASRICTLGTLNSSNLCVTPASYSCPFSPNRYTCFGRRAVGATPELVGDQCVVTDPEHCGGGWSQTSPATATCPAGFSLTSGSCVRQPSLNCPSGYTLNGSDCRRNSANYSIGSCPTGFTRNNANGNCERTRHASVSYSCSSGYNIYQTNRCLSNTQTNTVGSCASGFALNISNGNCERTLEISIFSVCNNGFSNVGDACQSNSPNYIAGICGIPGYTLNTGNGNCESTTVEPVVYTCLAGYSTYQTDQCLSRKWQPGVGSCSAGALYNNTTGQCERVSSLPITYQCAANYVTYNPNDCRAIQPTLSLGTCPTPYSLDTSDGACKLTLTESITYTCAANYALLGGTECQNSISDFEVGTCPSGGYALNINTGQCDVYLTDTVDYRCGGNFSNHLVDQCLENTPTFARGICTDGYTINPLNGNCEDTDYVDYTYECSPAPNLETVTRAFDQCSYYDLESETRTCVSGFTAININTCQSDLPIENIGSCNSTFTATATNCQREDSLAYTYYCVDPAFTVDGSQCSQLLETTVDVICADGDERSGEQCLRTEGGVETRYCDAPYAMKGVTQCESRVDVASF
jgi:hypothetical protein